MGQLNAGIHTQHVHGEGGGDGPVHAAGRHAVVAAHVSLHVLELQQSVASLGLHSLQLQMSLVPTVSVRGEGEREAYLVFPQVVPIKI